MPKLTAILVSLLGAACSPLPVPSAPAPAPRADTSAGVAAAASAIIDVGNAARVDVALPPLREDARLMRAAEEYAQELAERRDLSHRSPTRGRETMTQRIEAVGVPWRHAAENLASTSRTLVHVPREAIDMWLSSPGHRGNLLDARYTFTGAGVARDRYGTWYMVQLYATLR